MKIVKLLNVVSQDALFLEGVEPVFRKQRRSLKDVNSDYTLEIDEEFSSDIYDVLLAYRLLDIDYKRYRAGLQEFGNVDDDTWNNYPEKKKKLISKEKATTMDRINVFYNDSEKADKAMKIFDEKSCKCRQNRFGKSKSVLLNNVVQLDAFMIKEDMEADDLETNYVKHGMEGTSAGDPVAIYDFNNSTNIIGADFLNTPTDKYAITGLSTRPITFRGESSHTQETLVAIINDYLKHGKKIKN